MRQIFENATMVVVFLGGKTLATKQGFDFLNNPEISPNSQDVTTYDPQRDENIARFEVQSLLSHSWWKRMWVIQEIAVAKKIEICRGSCCVPWHLFCRFVIQQQPRLYGDEDFERAIYKFVERGLSNLQSSPVLEYGLLDLEHEFRSGEATNPRDKLYALLGLIPNADERGLVPDYSKPVQEVYMDIARSHIS
jgi:hypothetical protein